MCSSRQACRYLGLARSSLAYTPRPPTPKAVQLEEGVAALSRRCRGAIQDMADQPRSARKALGHDLLVEANPGKTMLLPALLEVLLERVEHAGDLSAGGPRRTVRSQHLADGVAGMAGQAGDLSHRMALPMKKTNVHKLIQI